MSEADEFSKPSEQANAPAEGFGQQESAAITSEVRLGRGLDDALAEHLRQRRSRARALSSDYVKEKKDLTLPHSVVFIGASKQISATPKASGAIPSRKATSDTRSGQRRSSTCP